MKITLLKKENLPVSRWDGGTSCQWLIYPHTATYQARDFLFRLSTAQAELEESEYTYLPGVTRHLMMLEGTAALTHHDHYQITMHPFGEVDVFDGGWQTTAKGKVKDFNLMVRENAHGSLEPILCSGTLTFSRRCEQCGGHFGFTALYCGQGSGEITLLSGEKISMEEETMLILEEFLPEERVTLVLEQGSKFLRSDVCF